MMDGMMSGGMMWASRPRHQSEKAVRHGGTTAFPSISDVPTKFRYRRDGEGFRMPAIAGGASGRGPASGNRPCTNPRAASTASMGI